MAPAWSVISPGDQIFSRFPRGAATFIFAVFVVGMWLFNFAQVGAGPQKAMGLLIGTLSALTLAGLSSCHDASHVLVSRGAAIAQHPMGLPRADPKGFQPQALRSQAAPDPIGPPENVFQVHEPVLKPNAGNQSACQAVLMRHDFANSYGAQFIGNYVPPSCDFDHVVINFTVTTIGRQYDRTGVMYFGDIEVWRTSTAEPQGARSNTPIRWVYEKDMTPFLSLWKQPQTLIFDLENIVNDIYTGILNTTLTATFFKSSVKIGHHTPADLIIPISERTGSTGEPSQFTYPEANATNTISFPRNVNRAVFTVDVKAQGNEEFWMSNIFESAIHTFDPTYGTYPGYSPWREVQVLIDGQLAGVWWPFPVIYTGGVVPQLHRPIVGLQAFDILEHEIDITAWLPLLCDGNQHTFTIKVVGLVDDGKSTVALSTTTESSWYITGKIFAWLDAADSVTTGTMGTISAPAPTFELSQVISQNGTGFNQTIDYSLTASRKFSVTSVIKTQNTSGPVTWTQDLSYSNTGGIYDYGNGNVNTFSITGSDKATSPSTSYSTTYNYPLYYNSSASQPADGSLSLWADLNQGLNVEIRGAAVFPTGVEAFEAMRAMKCMKYDGSALSTSKNGTANYYRPGDNSYTTGTSSMRQVYELDGLPASGGRLELYRRDVSAANDTITADSETVAGRAKK